MCNTIIKRLKTDNNIALSPLQVPLPLYFGHPYLSNDRVEYLRWEKALKVE